MTTEFPPKLGMVLDKLEGTHSVISPHSKTEDDSWAEKRSRQEYGQTGLQGVG